MKAISTLITSCAFLSVIQLQAQSLKLEKHPLAGLSVEKFKFPSPEPLDSAYFMTMKAGSLSGYYLGVIKPKPCEAMPTHKPPIFDRDMNIDPLAQKSLPPEFRQKRRREK